MSGANLAGVLLCWPLEGAPQAWFESDGRSFKVTNLGVSSETEAAADAAIEAALSWGEFPVGPPPDGWRIALPGEGWPLMPSGCEG